MFKNKFILLSACFCCLLSMASCDKASTHASQLQSTKEREMTVGVVQKEIRKGMNQEQVIEALGSPNIVTRDQNGKEAWVYDKIATEASYSADSGGIWLLIASYNKSAGAASTTQKTLTVVIKFDDKSLVESFSYNASKF